MNNTLLSDTDTVQKKTQHIKDTEQKKYSSGKIQYREYEVQERYST